MKKKYETPQVEKIEFDYSETVVASNGYILRLYTQYRHQCNDKAEDVWIYGDQYPAESCIEKL